MGTASSITFREITEGTSGVEHTFTERTTVLIGRDKECHIRFPRTRENQTISRHHCLLNINPPHATIRDLGSRTGTYVNDQLIGKRHAELSAEDARQLSFREHALQHGDRLTVGNVTLRVVVQAPPTCTVCSQELKYVAKRPGRSSGTPIVCESCQLNLHSQAATRSLQPTSCANCGQQLADPLFGSQDKHSLCERCRQDPQNIARQLLELAKTGTRDFLSIQGYTIERELGRGGMGAVYLAVHEHTGERRALKVMLPQVAGSQRMRELFFREVSITKELDHPHVVKLHDMGCSEGTFFFAMEYCEIGSLSGWLKQTGKPMKLEKAIPLIIGVLNGLEYAHTMEVHNVKLVDNQTEKARGVVHRDISPHNIFMAKSGKKFVAKIGDYGLAKAFDLAGLSGLSVVHSTAGKPTFMPRQQVLQFKYSLPEVDVWATAATLYYVLTLKHPRNFQANMDPWQVVLQTAPIPIRQRKPDIPPRLAEVIDTALIDSPDIVFKTASGLRTALLEAVR